MKHVHVSAAETTNGWQLTSKMKLKLNGNAESSNREKYLLLPLNMLIIVI